MLERILKISNELDSSLFLFGGRQTGKTTILHQQFPNAVFIDLLNTSVKNRFRRNPSLLYDTLQDKPEGTLVIIDEIGYTPITREQANRFFTFISDTYETNSIIFTTNKEITEWAEMMGDPVLTTAMLDRILHHAKCFSLKGESYRLKHPELFS